MTTAQALQSILGSVAIILALVVQSWLGNRVSKQRHEETTTKVAEVQKLVNGAAEAITARNVQLETELVSVGGAGFVADEAAAIAQAESGGRTDAILNTAYPKRAGYRKPARGAQPEYSVGLWQINMLAHPQYTEAELLTEKGNATAARQISNGGTDWNPWSTFTSGAYSKFLVKVPNAPPGTTGVPGTNPPAASSAHQVDKAWTRLMRTLAITAPQHLETVAAARSRIRNSVR